MMTAVGTTRAWSAGLLPSSMSRSDILAIQTTSKEVSGTVSNRLRTAIICLVAIVWAINFTAPIWVKGYQPAPELNVAFMAIVGVLTASYRRDDDNHRR